MYILYIPSAFSEYMYIVDTDSCRIESKKSLCLSSPSHGVQ